MTRCAVKYLMCDHIFAFWQFTSRGLGDVYKRQHYRRVLKILESYYDTKTFVVLKILTITRPFANFKWYQYNQNTNSLIMYIRMFLFQSSCMFWIPAQAVNFTFLPTSWRVVYIGCASFAWINILCILKRNPTKSET